MLISAPRHTIQHTTDIDAPIEEVWKVLVDIDKWKDWNKWTTLETTEGGAKTGATGKLHACYEGDDKDWKTFDFYFSNVDTENFILEWGGKVAGGALFEGKHTMRLEQQVTTGDSVSSSAAATTTTQLVHSEIFGGILPVLGMGLPYETLDRNYLLMNQALKEHVENNN